MRFYSLCALFEVLAFFDRRGLLPRRVSEYITRLGFRLDLWGD